MEHYRSTLAFAAFSACSFVAAGHILHPGNYDTQRRSTRVVTVVAEVPSPSPSWINPPTPLRGAEPAALTADSATVLAPRLTVALSQGETMAPLVPSTLVKPLPSARKAEADPLGELIRQLDHDDEAS